MQETKVKNPEQLMEDRKSIESMSNESVVIKKILAIKNHILSVGIDNVTPTDLSKMAAQLSVLMINLGQMSADAMLKANGHYIWRKFRHASEWKGHRTQFGGTIKDVEAEVQHKITKEQTEEIQAQYEADVLKTFYQDIERLVTVIQTRLRVVEGEYKRSNLST